MEISEKTSKNLWKSLYSKYQKHVTISTGSTIESEEINDKVVHMDDLEKRKEAYGICGECNEPGTGENWCQPCNSKKFEANFKNWTSGNKDIDEFIQHSQLNAVYRTKYLEWIPFENFENVTYVTRGGFGKIYSAEWPEGCIESWDIDNQKWNRHNRKVALKSLDDSSDTISSELLNEIKSHLQIYLFDVVRCYGITQDPNTKEYMIVLKYCGNGNLRDYINNNKFHIKTKINKLYQIVRGLLNIHDAGKVHRDFHSGNILFNSTPFISDLGMCQSTNGEEQSVKNEGVFGVLPYMAPEVLCGHQYTKAADIYSFGIIMNEFISEEIPYGDVPHDHVLAIKICEGLRPNISGNIPKLLTNLIMKCWGAKPEDRPTAKELYQILKKYNDEKTMKNTEIYSQIKECDKLKKSSNKNNKSGSIQTHPHAIYTSRLLSFKNLPKPVNSSDLSSFRDVVLSRSVAVANPISEFVDCQLSESDLNDLNEQLSDSENK